MTAPITDNELRAWDEIERGIPAKPWVAWSCEGPRGHHQKHSVCRHSGPIDAGEHECVADAVGRDEATAEQIANYIATIRNAHPRLVAEVKELRAKLVESDRDRNAAEIKLLTALLGLTGCAGALEDRRPHVADAERVASALRIISERLDVLDKASDDPPQPRDTIPDVGVGRRKL